MKAIVDFRTQQNGGYKWMRRGHRRGWWRVLIVTDPAGPRRIGAKNVLRVLYDGPEGIDGVTERSSYYIGGSMERAAMLARDFNERAK